MNQHQCCQMDPDANPLPRLIYFTAQDVKNLGEKLLKPYDLTIEQLHPLKIIYYAPGLSQRQIGEEGNKSAANLTRILDRLQEKSLIERRANPNDRRTSMIYLTPQGESLFKKVTEILDAFSEKATAGISQQDEQIVRQSLEKISANLHAIERDTLTSTTKVK